MGVGDKLRIRIHNGTRHEAQPYMHQAQILMQQTRDQISLSPLKLTTYNIRKELSNGVVINSWINNGEELIDIYLIPHELEIKEEKQEEECPLAYAVFTGFNPGVPYNQKAIQEGRGYIFINWDFSLREFVTPEKVKESFPIGTTGYAYNNAYVYETSDVSDGGYRTVTSHSITNSPWSDYEGNVDLYPSTYHNYDEYFYRKYNTSVNYYPSPENAISNQIGKIVLAWNSIYYFKNDSVEIFTGLDNNRIQYIDTLDTISNIGTEARTYITTIYVNGKNVLFSTENYSQRFIDEIYARIGDKWIGITTGKEYNAANPTWMYESFSGAQSYVYDVHAYQYPEAKQTPNFDYAYDYYGPTYYWGSRTFHGADGTVHPELIGNYLHDPEYDSTYAKKAKDIIVVGAIQTLGQYLTDPYTRKERFDSISSFYYVNKQYRAKLYPSSEITSPEDVGSSTVNPPPGFLILHFNKKIYYAVPSLYSLKKITPE